MLPQRDPPGARRLRLLRRPRGPSGRCLPPVITSAGTGSRRLMRLQRHPLLSREDRSPGPRSAPPLTPSRDPRPRPSVTSMPTSPTRSGSPTSPRSAPAKGGSTSTVILDAFNREPVSWATAGHDTPRPRWRRSPKPSRSVDHPPGCINPLRPRLPVHRPRTGSTTGQPPRTTSLLRSPPQLLRQRRDGVLVRILQMRRALPRRPTRHPR